MVDKGKRSRADEEDGSDHIDGELVLSIEKLQEIQDELERVAEIIKEDLWPNPLKYFNNEADEEDYEDGEDEDAGKSTDGLEEDEDGQDDDDDDE